jgi:LacI family transcriptional regulator
MLLGPSAGQRQMQALVAQKVPLVVVDRDYPGLPVNAVLPENSHGGWQAANHLIGLGHRRIACIAGPTNAVSSNERVKGYRKALEDSGLPLDESLIIHGNFEYAGGYQAGIQLLEHKDPPTAIFACNDLMAVGAISACHEANLHVPGDLSIVGFDDIRLATFTTPPLTTVMQPKSEIAVTTTNLLLERIRFGDTTHRRVVVGTTLNIRKSTAPPKTAHKKPVQHNSVYRVVLPD